MTPSQAATVYKKYMQPFKGQALLGTPAVTNGGGQTGLNFLESFIGECGDCSFDFINVHHYLQRTDVNTTQYAQSLKDHIDKDVPAVQAKHTQLKGLPIFVGEVSPSPNPDFTCKYSLSDKFNSGGCGPLPKKKAAT